MKRNQEVPQCLKIKCNFAAYPTGERGNHRGNPPPFLPPSSQTIPLCLWRAVRLARQGLSLRSEFCLPQPHPAALACGLPRAALSGGPEPSGTTWPCGNGKLYSPSDDGATVSSSPVQQHAFWVRYGTIAGSFLRGWKSSWDSSIRNTGSTWVLSSGKAIDWNSHHGFLSTCLESQRTGSLWDSPS